MAWFPMPPRSRRAFFACALAKEIFRRDAGYGWQTQNAAPHRFEGKSKENNMLRSIKQLYGNTLGASDGEIGHVTDFYFDDQSWVVRYLVADTGFWLAGRQVLLSPHAFGSLQEPGRVLNVNLSRKQIQDSPPIDCHKPVSRQYEEDYYRYYGWPYYWQGDGIWGMSGFPILEGSTEQLPREEATASNPNRDPADAHLRSTKSVNGYTVRAKDGTVGHVCDFMLDFPAWEITQLVVKTGHRLSGREVRIPRSQVERISYEESTVVVNLSCKAVELSPVHDLTALDFAA